MPITTNLSEEDKGLLADDKELDCTITEIVKKISEEPSSAAASSSMKSSAGINLTALQLMIDMTQEYLDLTPTSSLPEAPKLYHELFTTDLDGTDPILLDRAIAANTIALLARLEAYCDHSKDDFTLMIQRAQESFFKKISQKEVSVSEDIAKRRDELNLEIDSYSVDYPIRKKMALKIMERRKDIQANTATSNLDLGPEGFTGIKYVRIINDRLVITPYHLQFDADCDNLYNSARIRKFHFRENPANKDAYGKNIKPGIFYFSMLHMANFANCVFENIDFSTINPAILDTIAFANCTFKGKCVFPAGFSFKLTNTKVETLARTSAAGFTLPLVDNTRIGESTAATRLRPSSTFVRVNSAAAPMPIPAVPALAPKTETLSYAKKGAIVPPPPLPPQSTKRAVSEAPPMFLENTPATPSGSITPSSKGSHTLEKLKPPRPESVHAKK
jgi:hypothetical protein